MKDTEPTMHIAVDEHQSGWFPAISIQFTRLTDILLTAIVAGLCVFVLLCMITMGRRLIGTITRTAALMFIGLGMHIITILSESAFFLLHEVMKIPLSWYSVAALTILPMTIDIPRWAGVLYLLSYCIANAWVMACGIKNNNAKSEIKEDTKDINPKNPKQPPNNASLSRALNAQLFTGMRITIQS